VSGCACKYQLSIDAVLNGLMACIRCHNLMACATWRVRAYLRGGHHQAHALLRIALLLYDGGGAVHESINGGGGLRLRLLPSADAHHALITRCTSKRESLKHARVAVCSSQESHGWQGCTPSMCCSEQCRMSGSGVNRDFKRKEKKRQHLPRQFKEQQSTILGYLGGTLQCSCVAKIHHRRSCQDKWAAGKQLDQVKCRVLQAALREQSREVHGVQGRQATHCREAHAL